MLHLQSLKAGSPQQPVGYERLINDAQPRMIQQHTYSDLLPNPGNSSSSDFRPSTAYPPQGRSPLHDTYSPQSPLRNSSSPQTLSTPQDTMSPQSTISPQGTISPQAMNSPRSLSPPPQDVQFSQNIQALQGGSSMQTTPAVPGVAQLSESVHTTNSEQMMPSPRVANLQHSVPHHQRSNSQRFAKGPESALHRELYNVNDALNILCSVVNDQRQQSSGQPDPHDPLARLPPLAHLNSSARQTTFLPPIVPPHFSQKEPYANNILAQRGVISVSQIESLVQFFFDHFEPFVPFVHQQFSPNSHLPQHSLLLTTICAISAKYSPDANLKVLQPKLWEQCQKLLADMPWKTEGGGEGNDDQVAAVVLALLLLCEWLVDGLDTIEQYNRVSWIHVGTAVRLAQWSGILSHNKPIYIAINWLENVIGCRLGVQPALNGLLPHPTIKRQLGLEEHARLDVVNLLHLGYRSLYSSREATRESVENGSYLVSMQLLHSQFERWLTEFASIAHEEEAWEARSIMFEFNHCRLYVYSLALAQQGNRAVGTAGAAAMAESRKYLRYAMDSAVSIINFETDPRNPVGLQLGPPMRWIVRFIHAAVFLAKTLLCPALVHPSETMESLSNVVCKAANAMENVGPENFQLMGRYIKMMNEIKDHVIEHMSCSRFVSPQAPSQQQSLRSSPSLESFQSPPVMPVDGAASSLTYWDLLQDSGVLAGVDNTMLYMSAHSDGEIDDIAP